MLLAEETIEWVHWKVFLIQEAEECVGWLCEDEKWAALICTRVSWWVTSPEGSAWLTLSQDVGSNLFTSSMMTANMCLQKWAWKSYTLKLMSGKLPLRSPSKHKVWSPWGEKNSIISKRKSHYPLNKKIFETGELCVGIPSFFSFFLIIKSVPLQSFPNTDKGLFFPTSWLPSSSYYPIESNKYLSTWTASFSY